MKNTIILICALLWLFAAPAVTTAQEKQKVKISRLQQNGNTVELSITSPSEFYIGGNIHVLHIGNKHFMRNEQNNIEGTGYLKFFIPAEDYKTLKDGAKVFLSYGELEVETEQEIEAMCREPYTPCWALGKLNKKQLK